MLSKNFLSKTVNTISVLYISKVFLGGLFSLSNAHAMDEDEISSASFVKPSTHFQAPSENQWIIEEDHRWKLDKEFSKSIIAWCLKTNSSFYEILVGRLQRESSIYVALYRPNSFENFECEDLKIKPNLNKCNILYEWDGFKYYTTCKDDITPSKFLSVFYHMGFVSDVVIDRIVKHMEIEDFRVNRDCVVRDLNNHMDDSSTASDFKMIALEKLANIKDPVRRAEITWELVQEIKGSANFDRWLVINLCREINCKDLPFFYEAKVLQADLEFTDDSLEKLTIEAHYKNPIISLLEASANHEDKTSLNTFVKGFVNNDIPSSMPLEEDLRDLTVSAESIFRLLNIIREQRIEITLRDKK